ncbi:MULTISPECIES: SDR family NAD(P)-dependent oxidoreductase [unclassified Micromonospora]|uniref:SDR family NAD(P)-dependent oxidoreductase n=1 Tax=unclassified Micromonospora TaxID=2617518 RepID=UPI002FEF647C
MSTSQGQKVAVITGASQGIGAGLVAAYRKLGYGVVATSRTIGAAQDPEIVTVRGDIAEADTAQRVVDAAIERFGRIDTVVNNAGIFIAKPFTDYTDEDFARVTGINVTGFFHLTRRALPHLLATGAGHIVTITSTLADQANSNVPSVLASLTKGGLNSATKSLAVEYASRGVRANAVALGVIKTPMHPVETHEVLAGLSPVGRMGETSDVVDAVLYLESASFVTGEILHVDGGQIAGH